MTQNGDPLENAIAERVNGILKDEYLLQYQPEDIDQAKQYLDQAIMLYNNDRPHLSIGYHTPEQIHRSGVETQREWRNYYAEKTIM